MLAKISLRCIRMLVMFLILEIYRRYILKTFKDMIISMQSDIFQFHNLSEQFRPGKVR